jgi:predicted RNA binding protein YcfA (HicA-like mRNA interferase family)
LPSLRQVSGDEAVRALERLGFRQVRTRGSHVIMRRETPDGPVGCVVPLHRVVAVGTLRSVLRQAQVAPDAFLSALR